MSIRSSDDCSVISHGDAISDGASSGVMVQPKKQQKHKQANHGEADQEEKYPATLSDSCLKTAPAAADHALEQMTVLRALDEVTLLDKRITKKTTELNPLRALSRRHRTSVNPEQFASQCKSDWQSLTDLIQRRQLIKSALIRSNTRVQVMVGGREMTVAEVVERRKALAIHLTLLTHMRTVREAVHRETDKANMVERADLLKLDLEAPTSMWGESFLPQAFTQWIQSIKGSSKKVLHGRYSLDPLKADDRIATLQKYVDYLDKDARFILAEVNSRTMVTIAAAELLPGTKGAKGQRKSTSNHQFALSPDQASPPSQSYDPASLGPPHDVDPLQMSILRALSEITQLDQRIAQKTKELVPMRSVSNKALQGNVDLFVGKCRKDWSDLSHMLARRQAIKSAMIASNSEVYVVVSGERLTVAEVVERKNSIDVLTAVLTQLRSELSKHNKELVKLNVTIETELSKLLEIHLGGKAGAPGGGASGKNAGADLEAISSQFHENNAPKILDPLGVESRIKELEDRIEQLEREARFALSEANARTKIDITEATISAAALDSRGVPFFV